jgi:hypothetical protein
MSTITENPLTTTKKHPSGKYYPGWGDDVIEIVSGPHRGKSGFGFISNQGAFIWASQDENLGMFGYEHREPNENCRVIRFFK